MMKSRRRLFGSVIQRPQRVQKKTAQDAKLNLRVICYSHSGEVTFVCDSPIDAALKVPIEFKWNYLGGATPVNATSVSQPVKELADNLCRVDGVSTVWAPLPRISRDKIDVHMNCTRSSDDVKQDVISLIADYFDIAVDDIDITTI